MNRPGRAALTWRALMVLGRVVAGTVVGFGGAAAVAARRGRPAARRELARQATRLVIRLGPTFVKAGQILGTRRDVLPPMLCDELSALRDDVPPLSQRRSQAALAEVYGAELDSVFASVDYVAVAAGSVACVYRATLRDGADVAVKLRRPGIGPLMAADLALVRHGAAVVARLRAFRGVPVRELVDNLCEAVLGQLDFDREADSLERMRANLAVLSRVRVPRVRPDASRSACIVMDYVPDLDVTTGGRCSVVARREFAASTLNVMYQMLFVNGFVHCDLHPGNLYFLSTGRVVVLDAGFSVQLSDTMRRLFADFFLNMSIGRAGTAPRSSSTARLDCATAPTSTDSLLTWRPSSSATSACRRRSSASSGSPPRCSSCNAGTASRLRPSLFSRCCRCSSSSRQCGTSILTSTSRRSRNRC